MNRLITWSSTLSLLVALIPACGGDDGTGASTSELVSTCKQTCNKEKDCLGAEASALDCDQMCSTSNIQKNSKSDSGETCDYGKVRSKLEACLNVECSQLDSCLEDATSTCDGKASSSGAGTETTTGTPSSSTGDTKVGVPTSGSGSGSDVGQPSSGSGTGSDVGQPSSGSGSGSDVGQPSSGSDGSTSNADCSVCEHANACCVALLGLAGSGTDASSCDAFSKAQCEKIPAAEQSQFIDACSQTLTGGAAAGIDACK